MPVLPVGLPIKHIYIHRCREKSNVACWAQADYKLTQGKRQSLGLVFSSWNELNIVIKLLLPWICSGWAVFQRLLMRLVPPPVPEGSACAWCGPSHAVAGARDMYYRYFPSSSDIMGHMLWKGSLCLH